MADHLTAYVEFLGLPGSGKSYFSHKVAEDLRTEGYGITEPSWMIDHKYGKWLRVLIKVWMGCLFRIFQHTKAVGLINTVKSYGLRKNDEKRIVRNLMYKAYNLTRQNKGILLFDEGIAQMAVSMAVDSGKKAQKIYDDLLGILSLNQKCLVVKIDCSIEIALVNMDLRKSCDSKAERIEGLEAKKKYLNEYKKACESIITTNMVTVPFCYQDEEVVARIVNEIKKEYDKKQNHCSFDQQR